MSIQYSIIVSLLSFLLFWLLGIAFLSLTEKGTEARDGRMVLLAPVVGFAVISVAVTFATLANLPAARYAIPLGIGLALLSAAVLVARSGQSPLFRSGAGTWTASAVILLAACLAGFLPLVLGGWNYVILRGNGTDAFNYVAMANALREYPLGWLTSAPKPELLHASASLPFAHVLLKARWTTPAALSFVSALFKIPPMGFDYCCSVMMSAMTSLALVAALRMIGIMSFILAGVVSLAFCFGFWGQFVVDLRAYSHLCAVPLLVAVIAQLTAALDAKGGIRSIFLDWKVNAFLLAGLGLHYPEIAVSFAPALGIMLGLRLFQASRLGTPGREIAGYLGRVALGAAVLVAPLFGFLYMFAKDQASFAVRRSLGWESAYFGWLKDGFRGIWGLAVRPGLGPVVDDLYSSTGLVVAAMLDFIIATRIVYLLRHRDQPLFLVEAGIAAAAAIGVALTTLLVLMHNPWAAGKVTTYFAVFIPIWIAVILVERFPPSREGSRRKGNLTGYVAALAFGAWVICNFTLATARIVHARSGDDYPDYISHHGEYRRVNADHYAHGIVVACPRQPVVSVIDPRPWAREFKALLLEGMGYRVSVPGLGPSSAALIATSGDECRVSRLLGPVVKPGRESPNATDGDRWSISCLLAEDARFITGVSTGAAPTVIRPPSLLKGLAFLSGEYGLETDPEQGRLFVWTSGKPVVFNLFADRECDVVFQIELCPGRIRTEGEPLVVYAGDGERPVKVRQPTVLTLSRRLERGTNPVRLLMEDPDKKPTIIGADPRDLRLKVTFLGLR
jgi:hypothetical protein